MTVCGKNRQCPLSEHHPKLLGIVGPDKSMLSAKNQDLRQCFNWYRGKPLYARSEIYFRGHAAAIEPIILLNIILLNFTTMVFWFSTGIEWDLRQVLNLLNCTVAPRCRHQHFWGVILLAIFKLVEYTWCLCIVLNNFSVVLAGISRRIQFSILADCGPS